MPHRLIFRDNFYAGETVTWFAPVLDDLDRPLSPPPDVVEVSAKKQSDGSAVHGVLTMLLIQEFAATASNVSDARIKVNGAGWEPGRYKDAVVRFTSGAAVDEEVRIMDNTEDELVFKENASQGANPLPVGVAAGDGFKVHRSEYEVGWESPTSLADQYVIATVEARRVGMDAYKSQGKIRVLLRGNPP